MFAAASDTGVDMDALQADLREHVRDIDALLARNAAQARRLGLDGTPTYLVGNLLYNTLDYAGSAARSKARFYWVYASRLMLAEREGFAPPLRRNLISFRVEYSLLSRSARSNEIRSRYSSTSTGQT